MLSFGGGQDSTAILYRLYHDDAFYEKYVRGDLHIVIADTDDEHPSTINHVKGVEQWCRLVGYNFHWLRYADGYHSEKWPGLRQFYNRTKTVGSKTFPKSCTDKLKIQPIYKWLTKYVAATYGFPTEGKYRTKTALVEYAKIHGKIRVLLGIAADEGRRINKAVKLPKWMQLAVERRYPLVDTGWDRLACQEYISSLGKVVPPPSNCLLCPYMNEVELLYLYRFHHLDYLDWVRIEAAKLAANEHVGDKNYGVWGLKKLPRVLEEAKAKYGHMTDAELREYKHSHGHSVKSCY